jgi:hypothetical protein
MKTLLTLLVFLLHTQSALLARPPAGTSSSASPKSSRGRPPAPLIDYKAFTTLSELVSNRPIKKKEEAMKRYMKAFATIPKVQEINLHQQDKGNLAKELFQLRDVEQGNPNWQKRLTATIKDYLQVSGIDEVTIRSILGFNFVQRINQANRLRVRNKKEMNPNYRSERSRKAKELYPQTKKMLTIAAQGKKQFVEDLSRLVQDHSFEKRISALEVANIAEQNLRSKYPQKYIFTWGLKKYFQKNQYSMEESIMAQGSRSVQRDLLGLENRRAKRKAHQAERSSPSHHLGQGEASTTSESYLHQPNDKDDVNELESRPWWNDGHFDR